MNDPGHRRAGRAGASAGVTLYFIDIFACTLFCLSLALVGARFSREHAIEIELPTAAESRSVNARRAMGAVTPIAVTLRASQGRTEMFWEDEPITQAGLRERLAAAQPEELLFRLEASEFTQAVALAQDAGVRDIQIAYETPRANTHERGEEQAP